MSFDDLPDEMIIHISHKFLTQADNKSLAQTCKRMDAVINDVISLPRDVNDKLMIDMIPPKVIKYLMNDEKLSAKEVIAYYYDRGYNEWFFKSIIIYAMKNNEEYTEKLIHYYTEGAGWEYYTLVYYYACMSGHTKIAREYAKKVMNHDELMGKEMKKTEVLEKIDKPIPDQFYQDYPKRYSKRYDGWRYFVLFTETLWKNLRNKQIVTMIRNITRRRRYFDPCIALSSNTGCFNRVFKAIRKILEKDGSGGDGYRIIKFSRKHIIKHASLYVNKPHVIRKLLSISYYDRDIIDSKYVKAICTYPREYISAIKRVIATNRTYVEESLSPDMLISMFPREFDNITHIRNKLRDTLAKRNNSFLIFIINNRSGIVLDDSGYLLDEYTDISYVLCCRELQKYIRAKTYYEKEVKPNPGCYYVFGFLESDLAINAVRSGEFNPEDIHEDIYNAFKEEAESCSFPRWDVDAKSDKPFMQFIIELYRLDEQKIWAIYRENVSEERKWFVRMFANNL